MVELMMQSNLDRSKYILEFEDDFLSSDLDTSKWFPYYLPQWKNRESANEEDQKPWAPEHNGEIRVSNFQTGVFSGTVGSPFGQHRFKEGLTVQEAQGSLALYTPTCGLIELRAKAIKDPECMVALWMIGFESEPTDSAEICVMEIKKHHDPRVVDDFSKVAVQSDVCEWHTYSVEWSAESIRFYFDEVCLKTVNQPINYPMQLMLNIYEFSREATGGIYPKEFAVDWVRGYTKAQGVMAKKY